MLIHFPSIYLFISWYFIRLAYIVLHPYLFIFRVRYFPHITLVHPISSSILFISSLSSLIYSSWILSSSLIHSIGRPQIHSLWDSLYILHFIHEGMGFYHWLFEPNFLSFLSPYYLSRCYVLSLKTTLRPWHHTLCLIALMWAILGIGSRAFWLWWTRSYDMTLHWGIATLESFFY